MLKKTAFLLLVLLLIVSMVACGSAGPAVSNTPSTTAAVSVESTTAATATPEATTAAATPAPATKEKVTINYMSYDFVNAPLTMDLPTFKVMLDKLNIDIKLQLYPSADYKEKLNLILASGTLPDTFYASPAEVSKYYSTGIFADLTDILPKQAPNVLDRINQYKILNDCKTDDGKFYFIPKIEGSTAIDCIGWVNNTFLKASGITSNPTNLDEFYTMLKTFKEKMPSDTIPMTRGPWDSLEQQFYMAFKTSNSWFEFSQADGYQFGPYQRADQMKQCLIYMNKLYTEGLIDKDYVSRDDDTIRALSAQDKIGYFHSWADYASALVKEGNQTDGKDYIPLLPLKGPDGVALQFSASPLSTCYYISAKSPYIDRIMEMYNFIYSDEGVNLFAWGIEGDTYTANADGTKAYTEKILKNEKGAVTGRRLFGVNPNNFPHVSAWDGWTGVLMPVTIKIAADTKDILTLPQPLLTGSTDEETELANIMQDVQKYVDDSLPKFVTGVMSIDKEYDGYIAKLKSMNVEKAIQIQKVKFDRWSKR